MFVRASSVADFAGPPTRRAYVGDRFCYFQDDFRALGTVMWGRPSEEDVEAMMPFFEIGADPRFAGHASFVDARSVDAVDVLAFTKLLGYLAARRHAWGPNVGRQAILHPSGLVGVLVAGALHVVRPPYLFACFAGDGADAFAWAGVPALHADVETLRAPLVSHPAIRREVRAALDAGGLLDATEVARTLGISRRTLQRRLGEANTTFRKERDLYLSQRIEDLLAGTNLDLDAIAANVGLSSASHLIAHFRATHGMTPGAWRTARASSAKRTEPE